MRTTLSQALLLAGRRCRLHHRLFYIWSGEARASLVEQYFHFAHVTRIDPALFITDPLIIMATIILGSINLAVCLFDDGGRKQVGIARFGSKVIIRIAGVKLRIQGLEKIDPEGSYAFVSNHVSYMDTPACLGHIPVQFRFLAKKKPVQCSVPGISPETSRNLPFPVKILARP